MQKRRDWLVMKWDDIKIFMKVAELGSSVSASKSLDVNQTTVSRRIEALEQSIGVKLFMRESRGFKLTRTGEQLFEACEPAGTVFSEIESRITALSNLEQDLIKITGPSEALKLWIMPFIVQFNQKNPAVEIEIDNSEKQLNLELGEADVAIRLTDQILNENLVARRLAGVPWGVYCSRKLADTVEGIRHPDDLKSLSFLNYSSEIIDGTLPARWLNEHMGASRAVLKVNSVRGMVSSLSTIDAIGVLPKAVGDETVNLVQLYRNDDLKHNCWLVASRESYSKKIVRTLMKTIGDNFPRYDVESGNY